MSQRTNTGTGLASRVGYYRGVRFDKQRYAVYAADGNCCIYCGKSCGRPGSGLPTASLDHVTPHSHGGTDDVTNLITACVACNSARGAKTVREYALYAGLDHDALMRRIRNARRRHSRIRTTDEEREFRAAIN